EGAEGPPLREGGPLSEPTGALGFVEPPGARPGPGEGRYRGVYGRRRLRECQRKAWPKVPCIVLRVDEPTAELAGIDENLIRHELTVLERAEYLRRPVGPPASAAPLRTHPLPPTPTAPSK